MNLSASFDYVSVQVFLWNFHATLLVVRELAFSNLRESGYHKTEKSVWMNILVSLLILFSERKLLLKILFMVYGNHSEEEIISSRIAQGSYWRCKLNCLLNCHLLTSMGLLYMDFVVKKRHMTFLSLLFLCTLFLHIELWCIPCLYNFVTDNIKVQLPIWNKITGLRPDNLSHHWKKAVLKFFAILTGKHLCCFPVNIAKFLRKPFLKNTCERLLL